VRVAVGVGGAEELAPRKRTAAPTRRTSAVSRRDADVDEGEVRVVDQRELADTDANECSQAGYTSYAAAEAA